MPHWDDIQVGDILEWDSLPEKPRYKIVSKVKHTSYASGWLIAFQEIPTNYIYRDDFREGHFSYAKVITIKSKEDQVLEKIKYLDKRYHDRRVSV